MEDFNFPSPERISLLECLQESIGDVPPHFWAACQVCDLDALKNFVNCGREYPNILTSFALQTTTMAHYWNPCPPQPEPLLSTIPPPKRRNLSGRRKITDLAAERDGHLCSLTGAPAVEVAHIWPYCSISRKEDDKFGPRRAFWGHLKNFWPQEKITAWEAELFPAGIHNIGIDRVDNRITLSRSAVGMWALGAFALKPVSQSNDKTTLTLQFFWQRRQQEADTAMSLLSKPLSTEGLCQNTGAYRSGYTKLYRAGILDSDGRGVAIRSGEFFTLQTDDPKAKPLPSFALLELQWFLQRVLGMAGASEVDWPPLSDCGSDISDGDSEDL